MSDVESVSVEEDELPELQELKETTFSVVSTLLLL